MAIYSKLEYIEPQLLKVVDNIVVAAEDGGNVEADGMQYCVNNYEYAYYILNNNDEITDPTYNTKFSYGQIDGYYLRRFKTFTSPFDSAKYVEDSNFYGYYLYRNDSSYFVDSTNHLSFSSEYI